MDFAKRQAAKRDGAAARVVTLKDGTIIPAKRLRRKAADGTQTITNFLNREQKSLAGDDEIQHQQHALPSTPQPLTVPQADESEKPSLPDVMHEAKHIDAIDSGKLMRLKMAEAAERRFGSAPLDTGNGACLLQDDLTTGWQGAGVSARCDELTEVIDLVTDSD